MAFKLKAPYKPAGDQPAAISALIEGLKNNKRHQTLLGVTGSGKTFAVANVIAKWEKPTLVIAHNKTLAAQLASEYREFFPDAAVHYFVSYYDYYQPEAYVPISDTYIEKEAMVNEDIERLRHAATQALLTRTDVIIVASVSCIYGLGSPEEYEKVNLKIVLGEKITRAEFIRKLIGLYFERTNADLSPGTFRSVGNNVELMPAAERVVYRIAFGDGGVESITEIEPMTRVAMGVRDALFVFPSKHYVTPKDVLDVALVDIEAELVEQLSKFEREGRLLEADRLKRRTRQDIALIREFGYCNGIENYSRHFDRRKAGEPPHTLLSYFPKNKDGSPDFLTVVDESHVTLPQLGGMYAGDRSRKLTLVEHGFRLPSAVDNRPLMFEEFDARVGQTIYTSATPAVRELEKSGTSVPMIVRPTGLLDPEVVLRPITGDIRCPLLCYDNVELTKSHIEQGTSDVPCYPGQVKDFIAEAEIVTKRGGRSLVTVLTKKMAEDLSEFLIQRGIKARYLHSDIKTIERIEILSDFRRGKFDVLVGVNLLREGLDLPEVEFIGILDADKEGFLRSETSLVQTIGRAARNVAGRVILYADQMTGSLTRAIAETNHRRAVQAAYNKRHGITPQTIKKQIKDIMGDIQNRRARAGHELAKLDVSVYGTKELKKLIREKRAQMHDSADKLDFETAAILRDEIREIEEKASAKGVPKKPVAEPKKHPEVDSNKTTPRISGSF